MSGQVYWPLFFVRISKQLLMYIVCWLSVSQDDSGEYRLSLSREIYYICLI